MNYDVESFALLEDIAVCMYSLAENVRGEDLSCIPEAINALLNLAHRLGIDMKWSDVLELLNKVRPVNDLDENEVSFIVDTLRTLVLTDKQDEKRIEVATSLLLPNEHSTTSPQRLFSAIYACLIKTVELEPTLEEVSAFEPVYALNESYDQLAAI